MEKLILKFIRMSQTLKTLTLLPPIFCLTILQNTFSNVFFYRVTKKTRDKISFQALKLKLELNSLTLARLHKKL